VALLIHARGGARRSYQQAETRKGVIAEVSGQRVVDLENRHSLLACLSYCVYLYENSDSTWGSLQHLPQDQ
jgi:hypothetical protein